MEIIGRHCPERAEDFRKSMNDAHWLVNTWRETLFNLDEKIQKEPLTLKEKIEIGKIMKELRIAIKDAESPWKKPSEKEMAR